MKILRSSPLPSTVPILKKAIIQLLMIGVIVVCRYLALNNNVSECRLFPKITIKENVFCLDFMKHPLISVVNFFSLLFCYLFLANMAYF
jgi:hypothetical protein